MTQRNPMNERYTTDNHKGVTRKSASSAKPATKAASSVRLEPKEKTPEQKKAERKQQKAKQRERDAQFYNPPTPEYKRLRKIWWVCLVAAIVLTCFSFAGNSLGVPTPVTYVTLALAYVFIIAALYIDMSKCRKARQKYADEVLNHPTKEQRAAEKKAKADQRAAEKKAAEAPDEPKKKGLFGFGKKKG